MDPNYGTKKCYSQNPLEVYPSQPNLDIKPQWRCVWAWLNLETRKSHPKRTKIHYSPNNERRIILVARRFLCAFHIEEKKIFIFFYFGNIIKSNPKSLHNPLPHDCLPYGFCGIIKRKKGFLPSLPLFLSKCYQRKNPFLFLLDKED